jgi:hypothetical protein
VEASCGAHRPGRQELATIDVFFKKKNIPNNA